MVESVYNKYLDYMMSGVEDIAGQKGHYTFIENFERFNAKVIKPVLMRNEKRQSFDATSIVRAYEKITLEDAIKLAKMKTTIQNKRIERIKSEKKVAPMREDNQQTVTPKDVQLKRVGDEIWAIEREEFQFMESGENIDQLYMLFSDLLDRKLAELKTAPTEEKEIQDDIQDDYMAQVGSRSSLSGVYKSSEELPSNTVAKRGRRQSTGDLKSKKNEFHV